jgi:hypothetical protein
MANIFQINWKIFSAPRYGYFSASGRHLRPGGINMHALDDREVLRLLRSEVEKAGGQAAWARREGVNRTMLNKVLNGRKLIPPSIIKALKLRTVYLRDL